MVAEVLEPRRLFTTAYTVAFNDPAGTYAAYYDQIRANLLYAGADWAKHFINGGQGTVDIRVVFDPLTPTAEGRSLGAVPVGDDANGFHIVEQSAAYEVRTGADPNGDAPDVEITIGTDYLVNELAFDPSLRGTVGTQQDVTVGRTDAISVFLHELGHAFGFNGNRDVNGNLASSFNNEQSTFDARQLQLGFKFLW